jgi:hypothetical protein
MIHADCDDNGVDKMVFRNDTLLCSYPLPTPPDWIPPLGLRDAAELEQLIFDFSYGCLGPKGWGMSWPALYQLVSEHLAQAASSERC